MGDSGRATAKDRWGPSDARRDARKTKAFASATSSGGRAERGWTLAQHTRPSDPQSQNLQQHLLTPHRPRCLWQHPRGTRCLAQQPSRPGRSWHVFRTLPETKEAMTPAPPPPYLFVTRKTCQLRPGCQLLESSLRTDGLLEKCRAKCKPSRKVWCVMSENRSSLATGCEP